MILKAEKIEKAYKGRKVVKGISLEVSQGEIVGLLGPNGAGKTTSFYMIVGLIKPNNGSIFLNNKEITKLPMYKRAQKGIGYLAQEASVFRKLSVEDNILSVLQMTNLAKPEQKEKLVYLFAGLYQKAKDRRNRQYTGIIKFVDRQESLRQAIGESSKLIRKYRKDKVDKKSKKFVEASAQLKWNTRVFDQRTRLTQFVCEEPVFNTQRLGYQARKILTYLK